MITQTGRQRKRGPSRVRKKRGPIASRLVIVRAIRQIPSFLKLLAGLIMDPRVHALDKALVAGAIAYVLLPVDLVPDFIPFMGLVDDLFLVATTVRRLVRNAGFRVAASHWNGEIEDLKSLRINEIILATSLFLPRRIRRRLRG
jgi:uncharacterized membrane protein YkvA (DUF1232 family)